MWSNKIGEDMKTVALIILVSFGFNLYASTEKLIVSCYGNAHEDDVGPTINILINQGQKNNLRLELGINNKTRTMVVTKKLLAEGELKFYETFENLKQRMVLEVYYDDMGSMSSLKLRDKSYDITCAYFDE